MTANIQATVQKYAHGLKNRSEETRSRTVADLRRYVNTELREMSAEEMSSFMDHFYNLISEMLNPTSDIHERKGGIMAIATFVGVDIGNASMKYSRFANYLRVLLPHSDASLMEMTAKTMGQLALSGGTFSAEYVEFEVKRAFEWLTVERNENKRHAAVMVLRELAGSTPTLFYQLIHSFFECIFSGVRDPKPAIRITTVEAIRSALVVVSQRESKKEQKNMWYKLCFDEAEKQYDENASKDKRLSRDDWSHGSLLIINELLRCSNVEAETLRREMAEVAKHHSDYERTTKSLLKPSKHSSLVEQKSASFSWHDFKSSSSVHGSSKQVPFESRTCKKLIQDHFHKICNLVLFHRTSRNAFIQSCLISILPRLAAFNPDDFAKYHLKVAVAYLIGFIRREREKSQPFQSLGLLAVASKKDIRPHLKDILEVIRTALPVKDLSQKKPKAGISVDPSVFSCISMLARAAGNDVSQEVRELLDSMLAVGLSPALTASLKELAQQIPSLRRDIQDGLLKTLSLVLTGRPLQYPGAPKTSSSVAVASPAASDSGGGADGAGQVQDVTGVTLALRTLGNFDFEGHSLTTFVRHCADNFLSSDYKEIRLEAVRTCSRLLSPSQNVMSPRNANPSLATMQTIADVLGKLLRVGITDADPDIRYCVLYSLDDRFDAHLAQAENLNSLFTALNDEVFDIRELAMQTIGRLSTKNPAYVMPSLRKVLIQILTSLEHSGIGRNKEHAAIMLGHLVANAPRIIRPYMDPILKVLIPKLKDSDPNPAVVISILIAVGEMAQVSGREMQKYTDDLLPIIIEMLQDTASLQKREIAIWTLGQLVASTGRVVEPYERFPHLLDLLLNFLKTEQAPNIRKEVVRLLGLLGALDPYRHAASRAASSAGLAKGSGDAMAVPRDGASAATGDGDLLAPAIDCSTNEMLVNMSYASLDEFYPAVAVASLMRIIRDPNLAQYHMMVVMAITFIFKSLGVKSVPYIPQVIPAYLSVIRDNESIREVLFKQLGVIVSIVKQHIKVYLDDIFKLVREFWSNNLGNETMQMTIIKLTEHVAVAVGTEFKTHLPSLVPIMLKVFLHDTSRGGKVTSQLLKMLQLLGTNLEGYEHLLLPPIVKLLDVPDVSIDVKRDALETVDKLADSLDLSDYVSRIIHPLVRLLDGPSALELRPQAMSMLTSLVGQLGKRYQVFEPMVNKVLTKHKHPLDQKYVMLLAKVNKGSANAEEDEIPFLYQQRLRAGNRQPSKELDDVESAQIKKTYVNLQNLQKACLATIRVSKDDWLEWLRRLNIELLKESPSPAIKSCSSLAVNYPTLAKDLFNAAFVSCWTELNPAQQEELTHSLEVALISQDVAEVTHTLLNLAEFMEHCDKGTLPLKNQVLGDRAMSCRAYAKALHYIEEQFLQRVKEQKGPPEVKLLESLISVNNRLQQAEASQGVLLYARAKYGEGSTGELKMIPGHWYEKLHQWEDARKVYELSLKKEPESSDLLLGRMRCLEALGEWKELHQVIDDKWKTMQDTDKPKVAHLAAAAAWGQGLWEKMGDYVGYIPHDVFDGPFYQAVLSISRDDFQRSHHYIEKARDVLDTELTAMAGESYSRAYSTMVNVQMLVELEEVIQYKLVEEHQESIKEMWRRRMEGNQRVPEDIYKLLRVHSLVLDPLEHDLSSWLKYARLCRQSDRMALSEKTLQYLCGGDEFVVQDFSVSKAPSRIADKPELCVSLIKHKWMVASRDDQKAKVFQDMKVFVDSLRSLTLRASRQEPDKDREKLLSKCYIKLGEWKEDLLGGVKEEIGKDEAVAEILGYYSAAVDHNKTSYKAWHSFAYQNYEAIQRHKSQVSDRMPSPDDADALHARGSGGHAADQAFAAASVASSAGDGAAAAAAAAAPAAASVGDKAAELMAVKKYCVAAVRAFIRSIALSNSHSLQDILRLSTLWFDYGHMTDVYDALSDGLRSIPVDCWLQVVPQLIARVDAARPLVGKLVGQLLCDVGRAHPQALIYPLAVAAKSRDPQRRDAANRVLKNMREHSMNLVQQAMLVSEELIRVAILWHELWHEGLEEASRLYFGEHNTKGMFETLEPLHQMIDRGPQTSKEISFNQAYGRDLMEAQEWCRKYQRSNNVKDLTQAWDLYYHVFRRISKQLPQLTSLELQYVSPKLLMAKDLELAVPGTYDPNQPVTRIRHVQSSLQVITSKQRPRKLSIFGSNGREYTFLLKGHEDLRQDERVMQLFGLVNSLLTSNVETSRRNLTIQRYSVIPLSTNSGLIGWVPHCDTLHSLIRDYREKKKILLNIEHRIMLKMTPDYDHLTLTQKVEVFEHALENTTGDDLAKILWYKSPSSEVWIDRRTNYTRSLAVMSMVGYVLGLGDRHPSNLMLDRMSGKIIHIDFGDCFEVAMTREKFPEKIPFRLTRMLIHAMEVTGIDGYYRMTCERVMKVLRGNKDSVLAVLEAFVYDPLLNWWIVDTKGGKQSKTVPETQEPSSEQLDIERRAVKKPIMGPGVSFDDAHPEETVNKKALQIVRRVRDKLTGGDFPAAGKFVDVKEQVDMLIHQATDHANLCQCYIGWCPFW